MKKKSDIDDLRIRLKRTQEAVLVAILVLAVALCYVIYLQITS